MPTDFSKMVNAPLEVTLGGRKVKIRRLGIGKLFGEAEAKVVSRHIDSIFLAASRLTGEEKTDFLAKAMSQLPSGEKLTDLTGQFLRSLEGVRFALIEAMKPDQPNIEWEMDVGEIVQQEPDKVRSIVEYLIGFVTPGGNKVPFAEAEGETSPPIGG